MVRKLPEAGRTLFKEVGDTGGLATDTDVPCCGLHGLVLQRQRIWN
jgi:hypothetical protein